jgi:hypothetical protein
MNRRVFLVSLGSFVVAGCGNSKPSAPNPTATLPATTSTAVITPTDSPRTATLAPSPAVASTPTPAVSGRLEPFGFPLEPDTRTGLVVGDVGVRSISWGNGPAALAYSRDDQPSDDPERANRSGWNARTHLEYEGQPAVDW